MMTTAPSTTPPSEAATGVHTEAATGVPRWLVLALMSAFLLLVAGTVWAIGTAQGVCSTLDVPEMRILPGPQPCAPDATTPALVTIWLVALLLAAAFVVAFTVVRRRGTVLLVIAGVMLLVGVFGAIATVVAAATVPPIIYY